jgi:5-deoxy-glucuronate isomerase
VWDEQRLFLRAGTAGTGNDVVHIEPNEVGLRYVGLQVFSLARSEIRQVSTEDYEVAVLPLSGSCAIDVGKTEMQLQGRTSVFDSVSDFVYLPTGCDARLRGKTGGEFALISARATRQLKPRYCPATSVEVEVRGAGHATRQINNFLSPESPLEADKLIGVEVLTPGGNFSSYPPHKHDVVDPTTGEEEVEEIYYFRFAGQDGYGLYRQYKSDGGFDVTTVVRDHDVFLVPCGYHGPSAAVPGHDMYFLNVLAGPSKVRTMQYSDDPSQHWIRASWSGQAPDPRVPLTAAIDDR